MKQWMIGILLTLWGCLFLYSCATSNTNHPSSLTGTHPQFESMCSKCHTLDRVHTAHSAMNEEQMLDLVRRMARKPDSGIDPNDIHHIVQEMY